MKIQGHLSLDEADLAPSAEWTAPSADWFFVRLAQGQGYWLETGQAREIGAGDLLVVAPQGRGALRASRLGTVQMQFFRFAPALLSGMLTMAERHHLEKLAAKTAPPPRYYPASHGLAAQFAALCRQAGKSNGLVLRCRMLELVAEVFSRDLARACAPERSSLSANRRIKVLMQHLTEEDFLNSSPVDLAAYCGCSLRHFSRLFRHGFEVSLRERKKELRLLKARQMLTETDSRVMTVASACGFRHLGVFNAQFKKRFGFTPTECRRQLANNGTAPDASRDAVRKLERTGPPVVTET
jgi:AraC-like DNA-binding protein